MRKYLSALFIFFCLCWLAGANRPAAAQARAAPLRLERLDPASPAMLSVNQNVNVFYAYDFSASGSFRIEVTPMTSGRPTSSKRVSPASVITPGSGAGRAFFTLTSAGRVDGLLLQVTDAESGRLFRQEAIRVDYTFRAMPTAQIIRPQMLEVASRPESASAGSTLPLNQGIRYRVNPVLLQELGTYRPPYWRLPEDQVELPPANDGIGNCFEIGIEPKRCEEVVNRRITESGVVIVDCGDGSTWRTTESGEVFTAPDGRSCRKVERMLYSYGTALPPAEDPVGVDAAVWAEQVNGWLQHGVGVNLLGRIRALVGDPYFENYTKLEDRDATTLYERIDYRLAFLDVLMDGN